MLSWDDMVVNSVLFRWEGQRVDFSGQLLGWPPIIIYHTSVISFPAVWAELITCFELMEYCKGNGITLLCLHCIKLSSILLVDSPPYWIWWNKQLCFKLSYGETHIEKQNNSRNTSTSALLTTPKPLTMWITTNCGKLFKRWEYQTTLPASGEIRRQVKRQQLVSDMEQQTGSKLGKEYIKAVYCHPTYLTSMQSTWCKMPGWKRTSWNQDFLEKYQ